MLSLQSLEQGQAHSKFINWVKERCGGVYGGTEAGEICPCPIFYSVKCWASIEMSPGLPDPVESAIFPEGEII